ncbi:IclR family transcriptional regulator [Raoultella terrigena]|nr:IclR family transcriptional regulator [Raoultella terrigena]MCI1034481.1 IclR family transcriptional regulator [Raoultella terrigena]
MRIKMELSNKDTSDKDNKPSGTQSLFRGLRLIEILSNFPNGCPLAHLAELSGMNKSTVHRLLQGLLTCGYITQAPSPGSYRLTTKFISVGQKALSSLNIIHIAAPHLEKLNIDVGETVNFSFREGDEVILIYKLEATTGVMRTSSYIGQRMPLYCSAMGKIFMAWSNEKYPAKYWETHKNDIHQYTQFTITQLPDMLKELQHIRQSKIALDKEEKEIGAYCIAAPIFDIQNNVLYSVSISLATAKLESIGIEKITKEITESAKNISKELGFYG